MSADGTVFSALEDAVSALVVDELIDGLYPQAGEERNE